jgi:hypothetical protein
MGKPGYLKKGTGSFATSRKRTFCGATRISGLLLISSFPFHKYPSMSEKFMALISDLDRRGPHIDRVSDPIECLVGSGISSCP